MENLQKNAGDVLGIFVFILLLWEHGRRQWGAGGGRGPTGFSCMVQI